MDVNLCAEYLIYSILFNPLQCYKVASIIISKWQSQEKAFLIAKPVGLGRKNIFRRSL